MRRERRIFTLGGTPWKADMVHGKRICLPWKAKYVYHRRRICAIGGGCVYRERQLCVVKANYVP